MYSFPYNSYRASYSPESQEALEAIKESVQGERMDELFYDYLISEAPTQEEQDIIRSIRDDERKHNQMFRRIYRDFTGVEITGVSDEKFTRPESYMDGIKRALFGELRAVEKYRKIRESLPQGTIYRDMLFEIITDEIKHGTRYNFIYSLNNTGSIVVSRKLRDTGKLFRDLAEGEDPVADDIIRYIQPLITKALAEAKEGITLEHLFQKFITAGILIGAGGTPTEAIEMVEMWEKTGESKILAESKKKPRK